MFGGREGLVMLQSAIKMKWHDHSITAWVGRAYILLRYLVFVFVVHFYLSGDSLAYGIASFLGIFHMWWYMPGLWSRKSRHPTPTPTPTPGNFDYPTPTPTSSCISYILKVIILFGWIHKPYLHFPGIRKLILF